MLAAQILYDKEDVINLEIFYDIREFIKKTKDFDKLYDFYQKCAEKHIIEQKMFARAE